MRLEILTFSSCNFTPKYRYKFSKIRYIFYRRFDDGVRIAYARNLNDEHVHYFRHNLQVCRNLYGGRIVITLQAYRFFCYHTASSLHRANKKFASRLSCWLGYLS